MEAGQGVLGCRPVRRAVGIGLAVVAHWAIAGGVALDRCLSYGAAGPPSFAH
jgi:hypothetical protein